MEKVSINVFKLKEQRHIFKFSIGDLFFNQFPDADFESAKLDVDLVLDKNSSMITVLMDVHGKVNLLCDRTLKPFDQNLSVNEKLYFRYGGEECELSENLYQIPTGLQELDLSQHIFDFVSLSLPQKRLHPEEVDKDIEGTWTFSTKNDGQSKQGSGDSSQEQEVDPRWEKLKNLKK